MNNNISFQGKITFYSQQEFYKFMAPHRKELRTNTAAHLKGSRQYFINPNDHTLAVILRGNNDGRVIFVPTGKNLVEYMDKIKIAITELQKTAVENITALVVGGNRIINGGEKGTKTVFAVNEVADTIEQFNNVDFSILAGKKGEPIRLFLKAKNSKKPVHHDTNFKVALNIDLNSKKPLQQQLENHFDIVELRNANLSDISSF